MPIETLYTLDDTQDLPAVADPEDESAYRAIILRLYDEAPAYGYRDADEIPQLSDEEIGVVLRLHPRRASLRAADVYHVGTAMALPKLSWDSRRYFGYAVADAFDAAAREVLFMDILAESAI